MGETVESALGSPEEEHSEQRKVAVNTSVRTVVKPAAGSIIVGVDGSPASLEAVTWAAEQAARDHRVLSLVHAYAIGGALWVGSMGVDRDFVQVMEDDGRALLVAAADRARESASDLEVHEWLFREDARSALLDASRDAAMVVVGSRGRGPVASLLLGSMSVALVRHASCPVVVRRPERDHVGAGVLVVGDQGEDSRPVLETGYHLAAVRGLSLTVLTDLSGSPSDADGQSRRRLTAWMADLAVKYPEVRAQERPMDGPAARSLVEQGAEKDIVVVGRRGSGGVTSVLGPSLAVTVVEHAATTVVVVPLA
jgi:nucleotide-binding universal stress UspA family protein